MSEKKFYKVPKKTPFDNPNLHILTPSKKDPQKNARLSTGYYRNCPTINVWTADPEDRAREKVTNYGKIIATFDIRHFCILMEFIRELALDPTLETKRKVSGKAYLFPNGKRTDNPVLISETYVGKDKDGLMFISVIAKDRPIIKFIFDGNTYQFNSIAHSDGSPLTKQEISKYDAIAWSKIQEKLMLHMTSTLIWDKDEAEAAEKAEKETKTEHVGNSVEEPTTFDDDIPF